MQENAVKKSKDVVIEINETWCKGCAICVELCPEAVLIMEKGKAKVANLAACTACGLCELRCPDFAIVVIDKSKLSRAQDE